MGAIAGRVKDNGYIVIGIGGCEYTAHGLAWLYIYGEYTQIDHIDGRRGNNRISNLRKATTSQNQANRGLSINNTSGAKGVHFRSGKYEASIQVNGLKHYLGRFDNLEEAKNAYDIAAKKYFGEFSNG